MRKLFGVVVFAMTVLFAACGGGDAPQLLVDVVDGVDPVMLRHTDHLFYLGELKNMAPEERQLFIERVWPTITRDVIAQARKMGYIDTEPASLTFSYGSAERATANDVANMLHDGVFEDELIAIFDMPDGPDVQVAVECLNLFRLIEWRDGAPTNTWTYNAPVTKFVIQKGEGLAGHHVSYETAIILAEMHGLKLRKGGFGRHPREVVTPAEARMLNTDNVPVSVEVYPGDEFDLIAQTYNGRPPMNPDVRLNPNAGG